MSFNLARSCAYVLHEARWHSLPIFRSCSCTACRLAQCFALPCMRTTGPASAIATQRLTRVSRDVGGSYQKGTGSRCDATRAAVDVFRHAGRLQDTL